MEHLMITFSIGTARYDVLFLVHVNVYSAFVTVLHVNAYTVVRAILPVNGR